MNHPDPAWLAAQSQRAFETDPLLRVHADFAFERQEKIGVGGMGAIYRVFDQRARREAALKILVASAAASPRKVERFIREARVTALLDHPAIPTVYEYGRSGSGEFFILMKLIRGRTLSERIKELHRKGRPEPALFGLLRILIRVCEALSYAHDQGVIHRDVKPGNIMIGRFGEAYLMDWGLARDRRESEETDADFCRSTTDIAPSIFDDQASVKGGVVGTFGYMAPEQAFSGQLGPRSDLFSIGAILYECLTGALPVSGGGVAAVVAALDGRIDFNRTRLKAPAALIDLTRACLASDPADRPEDAAEVAARLRAIIQARGRKPSALAPWLVVAGAVLALAAAGGLALTRGAEAARREATAEKQARSILDLRAEREALIKKIAVLEAESAEPKEAPPGSKTEGDAFMSDLNRAYKAFEAGRSEQAIPLFTRALAITPNDGRIFAMRGKAYAELERYQEALDDYSRALELRPDAPEVYFSRSQVYNKMRRLEETLPDLDAAIRLRPGVFVYHQARAGVHRQLGDLRACLADLDRAIALRPEDILSRIFRAEARKELKDLSGAIADFSAVLERRPENDAVRVKRGLLRLLLGQFDEAIVDFDRVLESRPRSPEALSGRGFARLELGQFEGARRDFEAFLAVTPAEEQAGRVREWMKRLPPKK